MLYTMVPLPMPILGSGDDICGSLREDGVKLDLRFYRWSRFFVRVGMVVCTQTGEHLQVLADGHVTIVLCCLQYVQFGIGKRSLSQHAA